MIFRSFKFQIILRLAILTIMGYGLLYYAFIEVNYIRVFFLGLFSALLLIGLFYFLNKTHKLTSGFLEAILNNDFTVKYPSEQHSKALGDLFHKFNEVNDKFSQNIQQEANQYQYLLTLINQLKIAVIAFDDKERVHLVNKSFKELVNEKEVIKLSSVKQVSEDLYRQIQALKANEQAVIKVIINHQVHRFSITSSIFKLRQNEYKLVSLQDIHSELDQNEMQAWQRLIRVLTHEIMNSVSPIVSLSGSLEDLVKSNANQETTQKTLLEGMSAIKSRSEGLMNFTQAYRQLTRIPVPNMKEVELSSFFRQIETLFNPTLKGTNVSFQLKINSRNSHFMVDEGLMQQVLINLLKNAYEAVNVDSGSIILCVNGPDANSPLEIAITDNGPGIPKEIEDQIFIPFYTTKKEGSGIGLSLARQIIQQHGGNLSLQSDSTSTTFTIKL